jgi:hypothetical protein
MPDNPHQTTLQPFVDLHRADLADLREQADKLRETLRVKPPDVGPKPPQPRSALRSDLASVERSIAKHEWAIGLARDERVGEILRAVADDPELAREVVANPRAFAARHGFELPDTIVINMLVAGRDVSARISNLDPDLPFEITWTQDGFQAPPEPAAAPSAGDPPLPE